MKPRLWQVEDTEILWEWIQKDDDVWTKFLGLSLPIDRDVYTNTIFKLVMLIMRDEAALIMVEDDDGLVGIIAANPLNKEVCGAHLAKNPDRKHVGMDLIKVGEQVARRQGVKMLIVPLANPSLRKLLKRAGYSPPVTEAWSKEL